MILKVDEINVVETALYERYAEDEKIYCYDLYIQAIVGDKVYLHKHVFKGAVQDEEYGFWYADRNAKPDAEELARKIITKGAINTDHWEYQGTVKELFKTSEERLEEAWSDISDLYE